MKYFTLILFILLSCFTSFSQIQIQNAFPSLTFTNPVDLQYAGDNTNRLFVVEQVGRIKVFNNSSSSTATKVYLDITDRVSAGGEMGLLGLAFHPDYENNGYFYVNYTISTPSRMTRISRFQVSATNPDSAVKTSEFILLTQSQPFSNHNGGQTTFGADGYLYIAFGDGGSGGDPSNNAQNKTTFLGKILRIDVNTTSGSLNYGIPPTNPYAGNTQGWKEEIYSLGMRNPWRFSFDPVTNWLWCADVGQGTYEEIDIIQIGKNYGWRCYEGFHAYNTSGCTETYVDPIFEYNHTGGNCSVTGGFVYRGPNVPELYGKYIYADYCSKIFWSMFYDSTAAPVNTTLFTSTGGAPVSFGVDRNNELYVCNYDGRIFRFTPTAAIVAPSNLNASTTGSNVVLTWNDNATNENGFKIQRRTSSTSFVTIDSVGSNITTYSDNNAPNPTSFIYRIFAYNSANTSGFSNETNVVTAVPVEFSAFTASVVENKVLLKWVTITEKNNAQFEVERFLSNNWKKIGVVNGNGTSLTVNYYSFSDDFDGRGFEGTIKYRIKQKDFDGSYSYSSEVILDVNLNSLDYEMVQNYPNPFNPVTNIRFSLPEESKVQVEIINSLGSKVSELVNETRASGKHDLNWNASDLSSGIYFIRIKAFSVVSDRSFTRTIKSILLK